MRPIEERSQILGVGVSPITMDDAVARMESWIADRKQNYVCITGAHGVIECQSNPRLKAIHNEAGMVTPDGMPLVWLSRWQGWPRTSRVYGPDLMRAMTAVSATKGYRQFYYGGADGVAEQLTAALRKKHQQLQVVGSYCPPFRQLTDEEDQAVVDLINAANPDIVWVGLSTPKQELWMASHLGRINAPVMVGVGAAFDFLAGTKVQAPAWMQKRGLEWLFRLVTEPRRLWRRYAYIVPVFIVLAGTEMIRRRLNGSIARLVPRS